MAIPNSFDILHAVIEATPDAIFVKDLDGRYVLVNEAFCRFIGKPHSEIVGCNDFELYPEADARAFVEADRQVLATGKAQAFEGVATAQRGEQQTYLVSKGVYRDKDGRILGVFGISHDITELREAHENLERTQEALFRSQKMEAVGQLTGGLAHDFNNILAIILGNVELLQKYLPKDPYTDEIVEAVLRATLHGRDLTGHLLAFSRRRLLNPQPVDVNVARRRDRAPARADARCNDSGDHVDEHGRRDGVCGSGGAGGGVAERCAQRARRDARRRVAGDPYVEGEDDGEAQDRRRPRAGALHADRDRGQRLRHAARRAGAGVRAVLHDQGGRARHRPRLEHGVRLREAVRRHGEDRVESRPRHDRQPVPAAGRQRRADTAVKSAPVTPSAAPRTILVVEDEPDVRAIVRRQLESLGHRVLVAEAATEALLLIQGPGAPDLLLTDVVLKTGINGIDLAQAARELRPGLPLIFMSGYTTVPEAQQRIRETGAPLLSKPFTTPQLERAVNAVCASMRS